MRCLGRLTALGLAFIFVVFLPCSMWTFNTQRIALSGDTYKSLFADEGFYQELIPAVLPALIEGIHDDELQPGEISLAKAINALNYRDWERIAPGVVPADWVKSEVERNLDDFFGWLDGDRNDLVLVFHTDVIRERLMSSSGSDAIRQIEEALPPCTPDQEQQFQQFVDHEPEVEFPYCRPMDAALREKLTVMLTVAKNNVAQDLSAELNLVDEMEQVAREEAIKHGDPAPSTSTRAERNQARASIRLWQHLLVLVFLIPAALLSMIVIVTVRSSKSFFRWMGGSVIIASLLTLVPLVFLALSVTSISHRSETQLREEFAAGGQLAAEIVGNGMIRLVVGEFTWPVLEQAAILIGLGFVSLVISVLLTDPDAPPEEYVYAVPTPQTEAPTRLDDTPPSQRTPPPKKQEQE
jgi:hypothetical protein